MAASARLRTWALRGVYFLVGLALLIFLLRQMDLIELWHWMGRMSAAAWALAALAYLAKAAARTTRVLRIHHQPFSAWGRMMRLMLASSLAGQVLPFKLGELSYIYLLKKDQRLSVVDGVSSLLLLRIWDMLAISAWFVLAMWLAGALASLTVYFYAVLFFLAGLLLATTLLLVFSSHSQRILQALEGWLEWPLWKKAWSALRAVLRTMSAVRRREFAEWSAWAALEWGINYLAYHILLLGIGLTPSLFETVTAVSFAALASILPINSFGNFGLQEAGWATGLISLGYEKSAALTSGFATHLLTLLLIAIFGGLAWLTYGVFAPGLWKMPRQKPGQ